MNDAIGKKFNRLTVIDIIKFGSRGRTCCICQCECGNVTHPIDMSKLKNGHTRSCGCYRKEVSHNPSKSRKKYGESAFNSLVLSYKNNARRKKIKFELTYDELSVLFKSNCHYCGSPPHTVFNKRGQYGEYLYNGIDRMINDTGYVFENVVPCCKKCNYIKNKMSYDEFIEWVKQVNHHLKL